MSLDQVERIADALLYEGYMLYPYRPSAVKNRQRFNFGVLYPPAYSEAQTGTDPCMMQTECLVRGATGTWLEVKVRFLHLQQRTVGKISPPSNDPRVAERDGSPVERLQVDDQLYQSWREAVQREVAVGCTLGDLLARPWIKKFTFPATEQRESIRNAAGLTVGTMVRRQPRVDGQLELTAEACRPGVFRVRARVTNGTLSQAGTGILRDDALLASLVSVHTILVVSQAGFVSLLEPPEELRDLVAGCRNVGTWPVLAGDQGGHDIMLSSPIIVYDYPEIAPESPGDLFDGTENDELLSLRILTLSDAEKNEMRHSDQLARRILERTEALGAEELMKLHGTMRPLREERT